MFLRSVSLSLLLLHTIVVASPREEVAKAFDVFMDDPKIRQASVAFCILPKEGSDPIFEKNSDQSLYPASTIKLWVAAAALEALGPNYRFETRLEYSGSIDNQGMLTGDLFIKGDGDPTLGSDRFDLPTGDLLLKWRLAVQEAGIRTIRGRIVGDTSSFESQMASPTWLWEDMGNYYGAGASGLCINENRYDIYFEPGKKEGDLVKIISTFPDLPSMTFLNNVKTGKAGSGDGVTIFGVEYTPLQQLTGTVPAGEPRFRVKGSLYDPPLIAAQMFHGCLDKAQVFVSCKPRSSVTYHLPSSKQRIIIDRTQSPPIKDIVKHMNKYSINIYADQLFKKLGQKLSGTGSFEMGSKAEKEYLASFNIDLSGSKVLDGSGLSRKNLITARQMVDFLSAVRQKEYFIHFYSSLPVAGVSGLEGGGLSSFGEGTPLAKTLRAKTGSAEGAFALSGYIKTSFGGELPFTVIINNACLSRAKLSQKVEILLSTIASINDE